MVVRGVARVSCTAWTRTPRLQHHADVRTERRLGVSPVVRPLPVEELRLAATAPRTAGQSQSRSISLFQRAVDNSPVFCSRPSARVVIRRPSVPREVGPTRAADGSGIGLVRSCSLPSHIATTEHYERASRRGRCPWSPAGNGCLYRKRRHYFLNGRA